MASLQDITIYSLFDSIEIPPEETDTFQKEKSYICELYHCNLYNYKPKKVSRICINLSSRQHIETAPSFFGSICHCFSFFDSSSYFSKPKVERYKFLLNYIHTTILNLALNLNWETEPLSNSYNKVLATNFIYEIEFSAKKSKDRKKIGVAILKKSEKRAELFFKITENEIVKTIILIDKPNLFIYDGIKQIAEKCKWLDNESFGFKDSIKNLLLSYNTGTMKRFKNFKLMEEDSMTPN